LNIEALRAAIILEEELNRLVYRKREGATNIFRKR